MSALDERVHHHERFCRFWERPFENDSLCNCGLAEAAAELEKLKRAWTWVCVCNYANNSPICTHCGRLLSSITADFHIQLAQAQEPVESARRIIESYRRPNDYDAEEWLSAHEAKK